MLKIIICAALIITANGHPLNNDDEIVEDAEEVRKYENDLNLVSYIQSFKDMMLDYVKSQYNNLTINEMETIKEALEEFLHNFAGDLKEIVEKNNDVTEVDEIDDGIPDPTFDDVRKNIKHVLPALSDKSADLIVYKLRKNLMITRYKIAQIVKDSQRALVENDS